MKTAITLLFAFLLLSASKCNDHDEPKMHCTEVGTIVDMTGLDGCGLMIQRKDRSRLEVVNWPEEVDHTYAGRQIEFSFEEVTDMGSICMAGKMVRLTCHDLLGDVYRECPAYSTGDVFGSSGSQFNLIAYETVGTQLKLSIGYSGCDAERDFELILSEAQMKSYPPQNPAVLEFEDQPCEAYFTKTLCFDMAQLKGKTMLLIKNGDNTERVLYDPT